MKRDKRHQEESEEAKGRTGNDTAAAAVAAVAAAAAVAAVADHGESDEILLADVNAGSGGSGGERTELGLVGEGGAAPLLLSLVVVDDEHVPKLFEKRFSLRGRGMMDKALASLARGSGLG